MTELLRANNFQGWHLATSTLRKRQGSAVACGPAALLPGLALLYGRQGCRAYEEAFRTRVSGAGELMDKCSTLSTFYTNCVVKCRLFSTSEDTKFCNKIVDALKTSGFAPNGMEVADTGDVEIAKKLKEDVQRWVDQLTNGLMPKWEFRFGTENTIITVVSFKCRWKSVFDSSDTIDRQFMKISGEVCEVPTMSKEHRRATVDRYYVNSNVFNPNNVQNREMFKTDDTLFSETGRDRKHISTECLIPALRLSLPLTDGSEVMLAYPESAYHSPDELMQLLPQILSNITTDDVTSIYSSGESVDVRIPKLNVTSDTDVLECHNIIDSRSFKMTTTFQMDESGVKAAAATYLATDGVDDRNHIYFDRAFAFAVSSKERVVSFCGYYNA